MLYQGYFTSVINQKMDGLHVSVNCPNDVNLIILRSLPGAGKSTTAEHLKNKLQAFNYKSVEICSSDNYFMVNGEYKFDVQKLHKNHKLNQENTTKLLKHGLTVIADNTNTTLSELLSYVHIAERLKKTYCIVEITGANCNVPEELFKRNKHNVPLETIIKMKNRWQTKEQIEYGLQCIRDWIKLQREFGVLC